MENSGWVLLGTLVRRRREYLGLKQGDLAQYGGPAVSTVGKIERAEQQTYPTRTQHQLENALGWKRGTVREIVAAPDSDWWDHEGLRIDFQEALVEDNVPDLSHPASGVRRAADFTDDELLAELTYRMKRYAADREDESDGRRDASPKTSAGSAPADEPMITAESPLVGQDEESEPDPGESGPQQPQEHGRRSHGG